MKDNESTLAQKLLIWNKNGCTSSNYNNFIDLQNFLIWLKSPKRPFNILQRETVEDDFKHLKNPIKGVLKRPLDWRN